jgi:hypothetical protein
VVPADERPLWTTLGVDGVSVRNRLLRLGVPALEAGCGFLGAHGDRASSRLQVAVAAMTAHAARFPAGLAAGYHSYLSHLEDFLANDDPDGRLAATFAGHWDRSAGPITALVTRIAEGRLEPWEQRWSRWSEAAWEHVGGRLRAGADLSGGAGRGRARFSEYHRQMHRIDPEGALRTRPDVVVYRWCTNVLYLLLAVCDVRPLERYLAAFLVTRAVSAVTGHDWRAEFTAALAAGGISGGTAPGPRRRPGTAR